MRGAVIAIFAASSALACGGGEPPPASPGSGPGSETRAENRAPLIASAQVTPARPRTADRLALAIRVQDPEGDPLELDVEWFHNGRLAQRGPELDFAAGFARGDRVYAVVTVSDGNAQASITTDPVVFANQHPDITRLELHPPTPTAGDTLTAVADAHDPDGDAYELHYRWEVNGRQVPDATGPALAPGAFRRGDSVRVSAAASDREGEGDWVRSPALVISNGLPEITSDPASATVSGGRYTYALEVADPDGDHPLRYRLLEGPEGMSIDLLSGVVSWQVPRSLEGDFPVELAVSDPHGGEARQSFTVELQWEAPADADAP